MCDSVFLTLLTLTLSSKNRKMENENEKNNKAKLSLLLMILTLSVLKQKEYNIICPVFHANKLTTYSEPTINKQRLLQYHQSKFKIRKNKK